jgi:hypothetical protein
MPTLEVSRSVVFELKAAIMVQERLEFIAKI